MNEHSLALVFGYLKSIDRLYKPAGEAGLVRRFSFALDSYRSAGADSCFDADMATVLLSALLSGLVCNRIDVVFPDGQQFSAENLPSALQRIGSYQEEEAPEAFSVMSLYLNQAPVCFIETEFYVAGGGPYAYHDSYSFALYFREYDRDLILQKVTETCTRHGYDLRDVLNGMEIPEGPRNRSMARFLKRLFS